MKNKEHKEGCCERCESQKSSLRGVLKRCENHNCPCHQEEKTTTEDWDDKYRREYRGILQDSIIEDSIIWVRENVVNPAISSERQRMVEKVKALTIGSTPEGSRVATSKTIMDVETAQEIYNEMIKPAILSLLTDKEELKD